jgi:hypothetical protein
MDVTTISAAYGGLKATKDLLSAVLSAKIDAEAKAKILEAQSRVGTAYDTLFELREELFRLQGENNELRRQIEDSASWAARLAEYEMVKTQGQAVVYRFKSTPEHYACPSCVSKREIHILQTNRNMSGTYKCTGCNSDFPVEKEMAFEPLDYSRGGLSP